MNEQEKDTQRSCNHNYVFSGAIVSYDETEFVKTYICTECHEKCEQRSPRIGVNKPPRIVV